MRTVVTEFIRQAELHPDNIAVLDIQGAATYDRINRMSACLAEQILEQIGGKEVLLAVGVGAGGIPAWNGKGNSVRLVWQGDLPWERERSVNV